MPPIARANETPDTSSESDLLQWLEQQLEPQTGSRSACELLQVYFVAGLPHEGLSRAEKEAGLDKA